MIFGLFAIWFGMAKNYLVKVFYSLIRITPMEKQAFANCGQKSRKITQAERTQSRRSLNQSTIIYKKKLVLYCLSVHISRTYGISGKLQFCPLAQFAPHGSVQQLVSSKNASCNQKHTGLFGSLSAVWLIQSLIVFSLQSNQVHLELDRDHLAQTVLDWLFWYAEVCALISPFPKARLGQ